MIRRPLVAPVALALGADLVVTSCLGCFPRFDLPLDRPCVQLVSGPPTSRDQHHDVGPRGDLQRLHRVAADHHDEKEDNHATTLIVAASRTTSPEHGLDLDGESADGEQQERDPIDSLNPDLTAKNAHPARPQDLGNSRHNDDDGE
jgi:hypothetical protein